MASRSQASDFQKQVEETSICWSHQRGPQAFIQFLEAWIGGVREWIKGSPVARSGGKAPDDARTSPETHQDSQVCLGPGFLGLGAGLAQLEPPL